MSTLVRSIVDMTRSRRGGVSVEQGLIAALVGVVIVSVVSTLSGTLEAPPATDAPVVDRGAR
jgi:Flp pilus assembly pilin Flp